MNKIKVLPERLVHKIAAGEVVERPFSVVKELIENSIDAYASQILVEIVDGGKKSIRVADDGTGMTSDDALLSLSNHATSKLTSDEDLFAIDSLGFRGEAIPSIASIAKFSMKTKVEGDSLGTIVEVLNDKKPVVGSVNTSKGTTIQIDDLFYNIPARKKFLKASATEYSHILDYIVQVALCYHTVHFTLKHNHKLIHNFPSAKDRKLRISQVFGFDLSKQLIEVNFSNDELSFKGYIGSPQTVRGNMKAQHFFVNGRAIKDQAITHAVNSAYETIVPKGQYPIIILFIQIAHDLIDVNVHPAKREIRFVNKGMVHDCIYSTLREALRKASWADKPSVSDSNGGRSISIHIPTRNSKYEGADLNNKCAGLNKKSTNSNNMNTSAKNIALNQSNKNNQRFNLASNKGDYDRPIVKYGKKIPSPAKLKIKSEQLIESEQLVKEDQSPISTVKEDILLESTDLVDSADNITNDLANIRMIGQYAECYMLFEQKGELFIIDQHALHERIRYESMMKQYRDGNIERQALLFPEVIDLMPGELELITSFQEKIMQLGFEIEPFGGNSIVVKSVPQILSSSDIKTLFEKLVGELKDIDTTGHFEEYVSKTVATIACHSSVRSGEILTKAQVAKLLSDLSTSSYFATCPHGRNVMKSFSLKDIKKMFDRS